MMASSSVFNGPIGVLSEQPPPPEPAAQDGPSLEIPIEPPRVGMSFESMSSAKKYITEWCARERIPYSVWKADRRCWVLTCKDKNNCMFRLRVKNVDRPVISILEAHTCSSLSFRRTAQTGGPIKATPYNWPHDVSLDANTTALVLIDMQRDCACRLTQINEPHANGGLKLVCQSGGFVEHQLGDDISPIRKIIPGLQRLLHAFRGAGFPVYHTREGTYLSHQCPRSLLTFGQVIVPIYLPRQPRSIQIAQQYFWLRYWISRTQRQVHDKRRGRARHYTGTLPGAW